MRKVISAVLIVFFALWVLALSTAFFLNRTPVQSTGVVLLVVEGPGFTLPSHWVAFLQSDRTANVVRVPRDLDGLTRGLEKGGLIRFATPFRALAGFLDLPGRMAPGVYAVAPGTTLWDLGEHLCMGQGDAVVFAFPGAPLETVAAQAREHGLGGDFRAVWNARSKAAPTNLVHPRFYPGPYAVDRRTPRAESLVEEALRRHAVAWTRLAQDPIAHGRLTSFAMARGLAREGSAGGWDVVGPRTRTVVMP